jgi:hypothetical protein
MRVPGQLHYFGGPLRLIRPLIAFALALFYTSTLNCQQPVSSTPVVQTDPQPIQRDPQALSVLQQTVATAGWTPALVPTGVVVTGTVTNSGGDPSQAQPFTLKQRGSSQQRLDVLSNGTMTTTLVNGFAGIIRFDDGTKFRLPLHSAMSAVSPLFPFFGDLGKLSDLSVEIQDLGTDTVGDVPCHGVSVVRHASTDDKVARFRDLAAPLRIWISQQSGLPVRIDFIRLADDNPYLQMHFSRSFSDYRTVKGVAIAFTQEERFEGQLFTRYQFTDVQFTSALTDADFDTSKL